MLAKKSNESHTFLVDCSGGLLKWCYLKTSSIDFTLKPRFRYFRTEVMFDLGYLHCSLTYLD